MGSDQGGQKCLRAVKNLFTTPPSLWIWYTRWLISILWLRSHLGFLLLTTRFIISSRAKRECITQASQGGARPAWFPIDFCWCSALTSQADSAIDDKALGVIHEDGIFHLWIITMFTVGESPPNISGKKREQQTQQQWIQQVAGNPRLGKIYKQNSATARTSTFNSARVTAQRRQTLSTRDRGYTATTNM